MKEEGRKEGRLTVDTQFTSLNNTYSVALNSQSLSLHVSQDYQLGSFIYKYISVEHRYVQHIHYKLKTKR